MFIRNCKVSTCGWGWGDRRSALWSGHLETALQSCLCPRVDKTNGYAAAGGWGDLKNIFKRTIKIIIQKLHFNKDLEGLMPAVVIFMKYENMQQIFAWSPESHTVFNVAPPVLQFRQTFSRRKMSSTFSHPIVRCGSGVWKKAALFRCNAPHGEKLFPKNAKGGLYLLEKQNAVLTPRSYDKRALSVWFDMSFTWLEWFSLLFYKQYIQALVICFVALLQTCTALVFVPTDSLCLI